ncbi:MAG: FliA/WhiG family RNA polymerase sigma factor [Acidobacteria bacterium]|nr:FliA/WhiG family RNA polymerase sigma factor [Acidobacteriota bacterium]
MASKAYGSPAPAATPAPDLAAPDEEEEDPDFDLPVGEAVALVEPEAFDRANREQIIKDYVPLVKFVAHRISNRLPSHVELDDLIHSGILGLMDAVEKFDPGRGIKFKTYAELRVKGAILDGLRDLDWVPRSLRRKKKDIEGAYHAIEQRLGRAATDEEVATQLGVPLEELHKNLDELKGVTLGAFAEAGEDGEGESLISFVPDPDAEDPSQVFQASELKEILKASVELLPKKEKFVVQLYYFDELTMKEIGTLLNITESRVSQLHTKAMLRLRGKLLERQIEG